MSPWAYPQTNIQLYEELIERRVSDHELASVRACYELASSLLAASLRPSGKPFLCHLVGTAGILLRHDQPLALVRVGLLHAAYTRGDFGDATRGPTKRKRKLVSSIAGREVEEIIHRYAWTPLSVTSIRRFLEADGRTETERNAFIVRMADLLEDHLDGGMALVPSLAASKFIAPDDRDLVLKLGTELGTPSLAEELTAAMKTTDDADVPRTLTRSQAGSYQLVPSSYRLKVSSRLARRFEHARRRARGATW